MLSGRISRLFNSSSFRLSAIYALILTAAFVAAATAAVIASGATAQYEVRQRIGLEMGALQQELRAEGLGAAIAAMRTRAESPGSLQYQFLDRGGRSLISDIDLSTPRLGWSLIEQRELGARDAEPEAILVLTERTPNGGLLSVGDKLSWAEQVRHSVLRTLLGVGAAALLLALVAGVIATQTTLRRIDGLTSTMAAAGGGELSARAVVGVTNDDIDRLAEGVNQMLARIQLLMANVKRVSTDVAHDLRVPLGHVRQQLEAAAQANDPVKQQEAIRSAQTRIDDILRLVAAMLRLAEIDSGAARARFTDVNLAALLERVADAYRPDVEASGHAFLVGEVAPLTIFGDSELLTQALANLIENAMQHTPAGVTISLQLTARGNHVFLEVADNGPGVPVADRQRLLEPFTRLDRSRSSTGAGLGLSIVQAIARLHGGAIVLGDAEPGLRAIMELPLAIH